MLAQLLNDTVSIGSLALGAGAVIYWLRIEHRLSVLETLVRKLPCNKCNQDESETQ